MSIRLEGDDRIDGDVCVFINSVYDMEDGNCMWTVWISAVFYQRRSKFPLPSLHLRPRTPGTFFLPTLRHPPPPPGKP